MVFDAVAPKAFSYQANCDAKGCTTYNVSAGQVGHRYLVLDQSMIMAALDNALQDRAMQRHFAADPVAQVIPQYLGMEHFSMPQSELHTNDAGTSSNPSFTVSFVSANPGQGQVYYGNGPGCSGLVETATQDQTAGTTEHTVTVTGNELPGTVGDAGLTPGMTYWYEMVTSTSSGNEVDNNGGQCYSVTVPSQ